MFVLCAALAFCDWSRVQKTRRALARRFCHTGIYCDKMSGAIDRCEAQLLEALNQSLEHHASAAVHLKSNIQKACAAVFLDFFCSEVIEDWEADNDFSTVVRKFDQIFWEINQDHPTDVLPALAPLFASHLDTISGMGHFIREFVLHRVIKPHLYVSILGAKRDMRTC